MSGPVARFRQQCSTFICIKAEKTGERAFRRRVFCRMRIEVYPRRFMEQGCDGEPELAAFEGRPGGVAAGFIKQAFQGLEHVNSLLF